MAPISVTTRGGGAAETQADTRVVGVWEGEEPEDAAVRELVSCGEARTGVGRTAVAHEPGPDGRSRRVIAAGLGARDAWDAEKARAAAAAAAARARELGARALSWSVPDAPGSAAPLVEGTLLALYEFTRFKSEEDGDERSRVASLELVAGDDLTRAAEGARIAAEAQNAARDLQNLPANVATPSFLAERAEALAAAHGPLSCEVFDRRGIERLGMGAFSAVAKGSDQEPRLVVLHYDGAPEGPHLGYVGKAVTFDTGGISIKPSAKMQEMKFDMSGGAAVIESLGAIATLELPLRITGVIPATENMPSGHAVHPGDIVTALNGTTIEVNNTDAEGRLILADALAYTVRQGPERVIDLATLTGAIVVALGSTYAGLFSNDDAWCREVETACRDTGELGWRLPLHPEYFELTKGRYADLTNAAEQRKASSIYAAEFLRRFVDDTPWVHVDIAGTAWDMTRAYVKGGASGWGVRMLVELARRAAGAPA
jgi:leucyl aminopeptidase